MNRENSKLVRLSLPNDARIGQAARDWESEVNDVYDFANVASTIVDDLLSKNGSITLNENEVRRLLFCVYQAERCAKRFMTSYYEAIEAA